MLVGTYEVKRLLESHSGTWGNIIKMHLEEILRFEDIDWIRKAQDRVQWWALINTVMDLRVP
jgi:hypothetical protein